MIHATLKMSQTKPSVQKYKTTKYPLKISEKFQPVWLFINQIEFDSIPLKCEPHRIFNDVNVEVSTVTSERHVRCWIKDTDENSQYQSDN